MKEICAGTKSRNDVVHESLEQYREVFVRTSQQIHVLKAVSLVHIIIYVMTVVVHTKLTWQACTKYIFNNRVG